MKKYVLLLVIAIFALLLFSCSSSENEKKEQEKMIITDKNDEFIFSFKNLEEVYFVGEEAQIEIICSDESIDLSKAIITSSNENILKIENNKLFAIKAGVVIIKCSLDEHIIWKRIHVEKIQTEIEYECPEWDSEEYRKNEEARKERREALIKEAKEHGFDSINEYRKYLAHEKRVMNYQKELEEAEKLGLSYEDYYCLTRFGATYDVMSEKGKQAGLEYIYWDEALFSPFVVDEESYFVFFDLKCKFIVLTLGSYEYSRLYCDYCLYNNYGEEIDLEKWNMIVELMPALEREVEKYEYLKEKVGVDLAHKYVIVNYSEKIYVLDEYKTELTDEEKVLIEETLKEYEESVIKD